MDDGWRSRSWTSCWASSRSSSTKADSSITLKQLPPNQQPMCWPSRTRLCIRTSSWQTKRPSRTAVIPTTRTLRSCLWRTRPTRSRRLTSRTLFRSSIQEALLSTCSSANGWKAQTRPSSWYAQSRTATDCPTLRLRPRSPYVRNTDISPATIHSVPSATKSWSSKHRRWSWVLPLETFRLRPVLKARRCLPYERTPSSQEESYFPCHRRSGPCGLHLHRRAQPELERHPVNETGDHGKTFEE